MSRYQIVLAIMGVMFFGMLSILGFGIRDAWHGWQSTNWPQVTGTITESSIVSRTTQSETRNVGSEKRTPTERTTTRSGTSFSPEIKYHYEVAGRACEGTRITISDGVGFENQADASAVATKYAVGTAVKVWHHPDEIALSVLEPGVSEGSTAQVAIGVGFSLMFGGLLAFALSKRGREMITSLTKSPIVS